MAATAAGRCSTASNPVSADGLQVVVDEDNLFDTERSHTAEQLAFIAFQGTSRATRRRICEPASCPE